MKREEILRTAFTIAIKNGWQATLEGTILRKIGRDGKPYAWVGEPTWGSKDLLLNHSFAKALWAGDYPCPGGYHIGGGYCLDHIHGWKKHLQQMVIVEDPIKYLADHLPTEANL